MQCKILYTADLLACRSPPDCSICAFISHVVYGWRRYPSSRLFLSAEFADNGNRPVPKLATCTLHASSTLVLSECSSRTSR